MIEFEIKRTGMLIVVSAPSGGGKSTILRALLESDNSLAYSVSATTREKRAGEEDGRDYFFYRETEFEDLVRQNAFYEYARVHGNMYGTLKAEVDAKLAAGKNVLLDLDVQGSLRLKRDMPDCTTIFVLPPSMAELERRLRGRGSDAEEVIQRRLTNARGEVKFADRYDYILMNVDLDKTVDNMRAIIRAQYFRASRTLIRDSFGNVLQSTQKV